VTTIFREYEFFAYQDADGGEVMAGSIPDAVTVHLASGEVTYPAGSYEVIGSSSSSPMKVIFMTKEDFEGKYTSVETSETLKVHDIPSEDSSKDLIQEGITPSGEIEKKEGGE
jgi:hypothetical protein